MPAPDSIIALCETFATHRDHYTSASYNETELRREFLDPLFTALGWDVDNKAGYADAYKDVIHEDAIRIGGYNKAPDYCFRIGGARKFFVEAKKPAVDIHDDLDPAYQLRRYGWSAKLPLSILSDFEELSVYDCRQRPKPTDKASTARTLYFRFTDYVERWDELAAIFSREAVLRGSFDKYAEKSKSKRGTAEVDDAFLEEIERWRELFARNFALRNPGLTVRDLNYAVQKTIDRIIFLRICEDRGTEDYGRLRALVNGTNTWRRLIEIFRMADDRYNSGIFHFESETKREGTPDTLTLSLEVDEKVLQDVISNLYYPESPYEFSVLPADILGQVYERFLGKTIRLTPTHQAKIEEKPEVRKAGGVYYTPKYIVDYIVRNTLGRLLNGDDPDHPVPVKLADAEKIKVVDPACGSGSFLIVAYQYLLDWHRDQYTLHPETREPNEAGIKRYSGGKNPRIYQAPGGEWKLTTQERKRILLANIHGVDIDAQAVEVTKLSLLLKVLEGETHQRLQRDFITERRRILPDLGRNIQCGNSLIAPDFYDQLELAVLDEETRYRINVFDWKAAFPEVFKQGGFDCVIGNPPYGAILGEDQVAHLRRVYPVTESFADAYAFFIARSTMLLRSKGKLSFIIPSAWLGGPRYRAMRDSVLLSQIERLILLPFDVFRDAYVDTVILTISAETPKQDHAVLVYEYPKKENIQAIDLPASCYSIVKQSEWQSSDDHKFVLDVGMLQILTSAQKRFGVTLSSLISMKRGVLFDRSLLTPEKTSELSLPYFEGDVYRYETRENMPCFLEFGSQLKERPKEIDWFMGSRLLLRRLVNRQQRLMASFTEKNMITNKNLYVVKATQQYSLLYVLGILNSLLVSRFYLAQVTQATKDDFPQVTIRDMLNLPVRPIDFGNSAEVALHDRMVQLVERMLDLNRKKAEERNPETLRRFESDISITDRQIDRLVYELYNLTPEEVAIVEAG